MSNKFEDFLNEQLKDPKVKKEYDTLEAKYALIESIILARKEKKRILHKKNYLNYQALHKLICQKLKMEMQILR